MVSTTLMSSTSLASSSNRPSIVSAVAPQKPRSSRVPVISLDTTATYTGEPAEIAFNPDGLVCRLRIPVL